MPAKSVHRVASAIPARRARTPFALHSAFAKVKNSKILSRLKPKQRAKELFCNKI
ncbi:protein of unassigned function [Methylobacterium oryzae CBMB20]|uniref:Protein of unassigned function n=1 Tax=Methylobacterium oryzae CBMB20 TaxID=693986 RepID=A0A089NN91_9HYPH|nr:protein of unassigned function [Methylobacterium oryzae CBMB20]